MTFPTIDRETGIQYGGPISYNAQSWSFTFFLPYEMNFMKDFFSPGSLVTIAGAALTVIGGLAYFTGAANLSVPTLFYGFPIFLAGLAMKNTELAPAKRITPASKYNCSNSWSIVLRNSC